MRSAKERGAIAWLSGQAAEKRASSLLETEGFAVVASRFRTPHGELDLVATSATQLLVVEVKQRACLADAAASLSHRQAQRLLAATEWMLMTHPQWQRAETRIDLMLFDQSGNARRIRDALRAS